MASPLFPLILSGGAGSRLWPVSRTSHPKQFLCLGDDHAMIACTARRVMDAAHFREPIIISNSEHRFLVMDALEQVGCRPGSLILEPCGRNTAPALAVGALHALAQDKDAVVLAMPSDHVLENEEGFRNAVLSAMPAVEAGYIVTFGAKALRPETGYGYIQTADALPQAKGLFRIQRFYEKPDQDKAESYIQAGNFYWNMGIFLFKASVLVKEMQALCPEIIKGAEQALAKARGDLGFLRLDSEAFASLPSVPFDIAVMEKTKQGAVMPVDVGWSDVGSWRSLWDVMAKDGDGNAGRNDVHFFGSSNCLAWAGPNTYTAIVGVSDVAVVTTDDAVLVIHKDSSEQVREVVEHLKSSRRQEHVMASRVYRPWGNYQNIDAGRGYAVKRMEVKPGASLSLQYHHHRAEHWTVVEGIATVTRGEETFDLQTNCSTFIACGMVHRLENRQDVPLVLIEVQSGDYIDEEDIVRLEDHYGRV